MEFFLSVVGVVLVVEGAPWFMAPAAIRRFLQQIAQLPDGNLRVMGLFMMGLGLLVVRLAVS